MGVQEICILDYGPVMGQTNNEYNFLLKCLPRRTSERLPSPDCNRKLLSGILPQWHESSYLQSTVQLVAQFPGRKKNPLHTRRNMRFQTCQGQGFVLKRLMNFEKG